jgi:pyrimidine operon attenuation protein/uracil phosphoribosyltransferase
MALTREKSQLMSASEIDRTLVRLAHEILERTEDLDKLAFIGIRRRGVPLAQRLAQKIESLEQRKIPVGILDINLYRDDLSTVSHSAGRERDRHSVFREGKDMILMDDVLYTGPHHSRRARRAVRSRPPGARAVAGADRSRHRELPIEARYVGRMVQTSANEIIEVKFQEIDGWRRFYWWKRSNRERKDGPRGARKCLSTVCWASRT